jgi:hypothetical protein
VNPSRLYHIFDDAMTQLKCEGAGGVPRGTLLEERRKRASLEHFRKLAALQVEDVLVGCQVALQKAKKEVERGRSGSILCCVPGAGGTFCGDVPRGTVLIELLQEPGRASSKLNYEKASSIS